MKFLRIPALLLAGMLLCMPAAADTAVPQPVSVSAASETPDLSAETVYQKLIAFKETYPEGTPYTNDDSYRWNGGIFSIGYGCAGFAFMLSDGAFGDLPAREFTDYTQLRVGDLLRMNNDMHTVVVLEIKDNYIVVAEGNYNYSVHWGRRIPMSEVFSVSTTYGLTRYPVGWEEDPPEPLAGDLNGDDELTVTDAIILLRFLSEDDTLKLKNPALLDYADLDGDGMLTLLDGSALLKLLG